jgi:hypothetical protein
MLNVKKNSQFMYTTSEKPLKNIPVTPLTYSYLKKASETILLAWLLLISEVKKRSINEQPRRKGRGIKPSSAAGELK